MGIMLAIDGGGSRTRCLALNRDIKLIGAGSGGASNHLLVEKGIVKNSLNEAINGALRQGNINRAEVTGVSAGLAGVDFDGTGAEEMKDLFGELGFTKIVINGDMVIAHVGALGGDAGVLALAGTGSCVLGIDANGRRVKVGGWGPIYGDEGSAYRIGQTALRAAARDFDGRGEKTALLEAILSALGISDFQKTIEHVYLKGLESREIAALSRIAYAVAEKGDATAIKIFEQAGEELAESIAAAITCLNLPEAKISYQGAVLESCAIVREKLTESLKKDFPGIEIIAPKFAPVSGAFLLGCKEFGWTINANDFRELKKIQIG
jgi:N-acetylglucosamine kinase-like BadF-type ATPase